MARKTTFPPIPVAQVQPVVITQVQPEAFTIDEFCEAHRLSKSELYKLVAEGRAPKIIRTGSTDVRISREAAAEWRLAMATEWKVDVKRSDSAKAARAASNAGLTA